MVQREWESTYYALPINELQKRTYFLAFSPERPDIKAELMELPEGSLNDYENELREAR
jgi:hypothetical protein